MSENNEVSELLALAARAESVGINLARRAFRSPIEWDHKSLADSAHGFAVAAALRALAAAETDALLIENAERFVAEFAGEPF